MTTLPYASHLHHPSHTHCLELSDLSNLPVHAAPDLRLLCSGCRCQASGLIYSCERCNFALHAPCAHMPPLVAHQGHKTYPLKLLATPTYARGRFDCDGCGQRGRGFSYHCAECTYDLRIVCASKPLRIHDQSHCHVLHLTFNCPYEIRGFNGDICTATGGDHWMYRCSYRNFDVHLECAKARPVQAVTPAPPQASSVAAAQPVYIPSGSNPQYQYQTPAV
ncbi:protein VACUOLELESS GAMETOPHYTES-like [Syzygium oleosum]|uniref:protein VACUOLELESS GAMETOPHYTES-like n=1 Tax=Syzygium oleosum TaxID=219896 RepID=UPI0024BA895C|nr:protein VACUOLELESS GAMETOPHYTES-like [Syzygium oleosum]